MKLSLGLSPRDYSVSGGAVAYDTDAQAYFTANTTITSDADKNAINTFYLGLKTDGVYTKIKAMYLPLWSSASSNKWNLKDPRDLDAAFRLTFSTGWTHSSGGMTPNGTSAYGNTFFIPSSNLTLHNAHMSYYSRTSGMATGSTALMGALSNTGVYNPLQSFYISRTSTTIGVTQNSENIASDTVVSSQTNSQAFLINSRTSSTATTLKLFKNGIPLNNATTSTAGQALNTNSLYIGAMRNMSASSPFASNFSNCQCSFTSIGNGLTDTEASNFYTRVNTLMTYFGINV
jgi:hypothetical protein